MYKISINQLIGNEDSDTYMILLSAYNNDKSYNMPLIVDKYLAEMFASAKMNEPFVANDAYSLMVQAIEALDGVVTGLYINDRDNGNYRCSINILSDKKKTEIPCVLFDLVIISIMYSIPIYMTDKAVNSALKTVSEQREEFDKNGYDYDEIHGSQSPDVKIRRLNSEEIKIAREIEPYKAYLESIKYKM